MAVHARTLEIYRKLDIAEEALRLGAEGKGANIWADGRWTTRIPLGDIGQGISAYPFVLMLGQDDNERILGDLLEGLGVHIDWNTELVALQQNETHAAVTLRQQNGSEVHREFAWVAGCDGAHSGVRRFCRIGFPGAPYEHTFFVADTVATGPMKPRELNVYLWRDGFHLFFPMRGQDRWRVIGILPEQLRKDSNVTFDKVVPDIRHVAGAQLAFRSCDWFSVYRISHRAAENFSSGRCFLLGDAAHIHSPMGGQGMNTGLQDAYNLAWKLALVVTGRARPELLDSYEQERLPVARRLLATTDRAFQLVVSDTRFASLLRTRIVGKVVAAAMRIAWLRRRAFMTLSQTGIAYPDSRLSQRADGMPTSAPRAGDRFPWLHLELTAGGGARDLFAALDDMRFQLLLFGASPPPDIVTGFEDVVSVMTIPASAANDAALSAAHIPRPSFFLLRPDGHVGLSGATADRAAIAHYLTERVRLAAHATAASGSPGSH